MSLAVHAVAELRVSVAVVKLDDFCVWRWPIPFDQLVVLCFARRQLLNNVWKQFTKLGSPVTSSLAMGSEYAGPVVEVGEFETPQAANTTVLVTGATGRWASVPRRGTPETECP